MPKFFKLSLFGLLVLFAAIAGRFWFAPATDFVTLDPGPFRAAYLIEDDAADFDFLQVIVQAGEVDHDGPEGLAHYVEHLAWLNQLVVKDASSSRHSNAWTSRLATGYFVSGPSEDLAKNLRRLVSTSKPYPLSPAFIAQERGIVMREYAQRVGENVLYPIHREIESVLFEGSPMGRAVIGTPESIAGYTNDIAAALHEETHQLSNMVLVAHGKMKASALRREIAKLERAEPRPVTPIPSIPTAPLRDERDINAPKLSAERLFYEKIVALPDGPISPKTSAALWVLDDIIDSTLPGGIATPLRFDNFIAASFDVDLFEQAPDHLRLSFSARPDVGVDLMELQTAFEATLAEIFETGIPVETFDKIKERLLEDIEDTDDKPAYNRSGLIHHVALRRAPRGHSSDLKVVTELEYEDVSALLETLSSEGRVVIRRARLP